MFPPGRTKARDEPVAHGIGVLRHDNGDRGSCRLGGACCRGTTRDNYVYFQTNQFRRKLIQAIYLSTGISILDDKIFPFRVPKLKQALAKCVDAIGVRSRGDSAR